MLDSKALQRLVILNYKNADNEELVGLALELVEESNGGIQVRVLRDSNVVSCVSVVPLKECKVDDLQGCDCCEYLAAITTRATLIITSKTISKWM